MISAEITSRNVELQRKIIRAINEEIGSDMKQLNKLKELYDETQTIYNDLKEKVGSVNREFSPIKTYIKHFSCSLKWRGLRRCRRLFRTLKNCRELPTG